MKKYISTILAMYLIMIICSSSVFAGEADKILVGEPTMPGNTFYQPNFSNTNAFMLYFEVGDWGRAVGSTLITIRNADEVKMYMYLQRYEGGRWKTIKSWVETDEDDSCAMMEREWYVESGYQYRVRVSAYVYSDGKLVESLLQDSRDVIYL